MFDSPYPGDILVVDVGLLCLVFAIRAAFRVSLANLPLESRKKEIAGLCLFSGWLLITIVLLLFHHHVLGVAPSAR